MKKLRAVIDKYSGWKDLEVFIERIDAYADRDFSLALENAKALLETIAKEICTQNGAELGHRPSMSIVLKAAFSSIGLSSSDHITQISTALANIGQQMGNLRNDVGTSSHGRTLQEVRDRNMAIDALSREMLLGSSELVSCFLISNFQALKITKQPLEKIEYVDCSDFNDFWDDEFGDFEMGDYSFTASEILFQVDNTAYSSEYRNYKEEDE